MQDVQRRFEWVEAGLEHGEDSGDGGNWVGRNRPQYRAHWSRLKLNDGKLGIEASEMRTRMGGLPNVR